MSFTASTSLIINVPLAVAVPSAALSNPPASVTSPVLVPVMIALSLVPLMVTVTVCGVPSAVVTTKVSIRVASAPSACTVALLLLRV